jgi:lipopolysaccharide transport protein LptA
MEETRMKTRYALIAMAVLMLAGIGWGQGAGRNFNLRGTPTGTVDVDFEKNVLQATGGATLTSGDLSATSQRMTISLAQTPNQMQRLEAEGKVVMKMTYLDSQKRPTRIDAQADRAVYEAATNQLVLTGHAVLDLKQVALGRTAHWTATELTVFLSENKVSGKDTDLEVTLSGPAGAAQP